MLKVFIQWLLNTRTTPAEAAHSCLPNSTSVNITPDPSGTGTYVPPQDGYVTVTLKSGENSLVSFWGSLNTSNTSYAGSNKVQPKVFMPVEKGRSIGYTYSGEFLSFVFTTMKGIGGGRLSSIQGGAICLNNLLHFLRRSFLLTRRSGSGINPCRLIIPCHLRQFGMNGRLLPLLLTGIFTFIARTLQELISYAIVLVSSQVRIHKGYLGQLFHVVKESRLATLFIRTIATLFVRLFSLKLSAAKTQGGAL